MRRSRATISQKRSGAWGVATSSTSTHLTSRCPPRRRSPRTRVALRQRGSGAPGGGAAPIRFAQGARAAVELRLPDHAQSLPRVRSISSVPARRAINSVGHGRGPVEESWCAASTTRCDRRRRDYVLERGGTVGRGAGDVRAGRWGNPSKDGGRGRGRQDAPGLSLIRRGVGRVGRSCYLARDVELGSHVARRCLRRRRDGVDHRLRPQGDGQDGRRRVDPGAKVGSGATATAGKVVTAHYTGKFPDGTKFDSSYDSGGPVEFLSAPAR